MFVVTADQVDSRHDVDRAAAVVERLESAHRGALALPVDQTAGDEVQLVTAEAETALASVLDLTRSGRWSVGLGVGSVRTPLPDAARKATGDAFIAARDAVDAAKRDESRFALRTRRTPETIVTAELVEPLLRMLLVARRRRSDQGWEVSDLMRSGHTQKEAAGILGITPAAVSQRLRAGLWRLDEEAQPALVTLLRELDATVSAANSAKGTEPSA
ncbi:DNA-binding protein [Rathayibacter sp. YIM 133350]|uniref:DNA-binding protein n=1 Tax=Rathayibacter sp. YIM 133350 TaxID=3131992 RepID=UPI00307EA8E6